MGGVNKLGQAWVKRFHKNILFSFFIEIFPKNKFYGVIKNLLPIIYVQPPTLMSLNVFAKKIENLCFYVQLHSIDEADRKYNFRAFFSRIIYTLDDSC